MTIQCGYDLDCKQCGPKSARWSIDAPMRPEESKQQEIQWSFNSQFRYVTQPNHKGHDYKIVKEYRGI